MTLVVKQKDTASVALIKDGSYKAALTNIKQFTNTYGQRIGFEFTVLGGDANGNKVMRSTAPQLTKESKLAQVIEGVLGRDMTEKELRDGFDLDALLGKQCSILVLQAKSKTGAVYSNVERVFPA